VSEGDDRPDNVALQGGIHPVSELSADATNNAEPSLAVGRVDRDRFAEAVRLNREHWAQTGRPISAETLRKRLRLGAAKSRAWRHVIRAKDRAAVCDIG
jgi:hypothetical protein